MAYIYQKNDNFYDVESLSNIFTVAFWYPAQNKIIISYIDDDHIIKTDYDLNYIRDYIYEEHPHLAKNNTQILFEDIQQCGSLNNFDPDENNHTLGMQTFAKRFGLANEKTYINTHIKDRGEKAGELQYHPFYYPVKDTDPDYDPIEHGYMFGYNSTNYDTTIIAYMLSLINDKYFTCDYDHQTIQINNQPLTAQSLRDFNDELFEKNWKNQMSKRLAHDPEARSGRTENYRNPAWILRKAWLLTGRYIDVSRLNEKQQKVGLKRLLGVLGHRIMESEKLSHDSRIEDLTQLAELMAYNISDDINLQNLFDHVAYQNAFQVRITLLESYPQTVYNKNKDGKADIGNYTNIRKDRLAKDSTSAKFVELALAPYDPLKDIPVVSFMYPSKQEAEKLGIEQTDILEDTKRFFEENVCNDPYDQAHIDFMKVYHFYAGIRGTNYNNSDAYRQHYGDYGQLPPELTPHTYDDIRQRMSQFNTNLFYFYLNEDKKPYRSSCLANFSVGGIHGAEINVDKYNKEYDRYIQESKLLEYVIQNFDSATDALNCGSTYIQIPEHIVIPQRLIEKIKGDRTLKIREFVKTGSTKKSATWKTINEVELFEFKDKNWKIKDKYTYVSVGASHHEDFTSYYPLLLSRLSAFVNPEFHGYNENGEPRDPYYEMFLERKAKKIESKNKSLPADVRAAANREQESRKLLINAASGAGDAKFKNNILVNNAIISMRIIGQLFAWRIGQAQALAGARVPSTNTDGLYTMDISAELNDEILNNIAKDMHIGIEPERLSRFVSKDSNNRIEIEHNEIVDAKGGTLKAWNGPKPTEALDHPAILDWVLAHYLADNTVENPTIVPFDKDRAQALFTKFIQEKIQKDEHAEILRYFQWIVASSTGTHRYYYIKHINKHNGDVKIENIQQYNRIFLIKDDQNYRSELYLATRALMQAARWKNRHDLYYKGEIQHNQIREHHEEALYILKENGLDLIKETTFESSDHFKDEAKIQKVRNMPQNQNIGVYNDSLFILEKSEMMEMINKIDIDAYTEMLENTFKTWSNLEQ